MKNTSILALLLTALASAVWAGPFDDHEDHDQAGWELSGVVDVRLARTSKRRTWLYNIVRGGPGKLRFGGRDVNADLIGDRAATVFSVPQAAFTLEAPVAPGTHVHLQANANADSDTGDATGGLTMAYLNSDLGSGADTFRVRAGAFVPPLSLEHPEGGWTTRYTVTPSAIASWAGEDLRAFGVEGSWKHRFGKQTATRLTAGLFSGGDQSGWILVDRGWALHDYFPELNFKYRNTVGDVQRPFKELDGRLGFYARGDLEFLDRMLLVTGGTFDNRGDETVQTIGSHLDVYHIKYADLGLKFERKRLTVIAQALQGNVESLSYTKGILGDRDVQSAFLLVSHEFGRLRLSGRADTFKVQGLEKGTALTAAATWRLSVRHQVTAEVVSAKQDPVVGVDATDSLATLNYRLRF